MLRNVWLFAAQWTVACQTSLFTEFSRQEYWSGLPFPTPGDLLNPGIKPLHLLHWQADSLPLSHLGSNIQGLPQPITAFAIIARLWSTKRLKLEKKLRLKLKKVGRTTRPIRYDLNQISYDYTVEVINRFKGWDLRDKGLKTKNHGHRCFTLYRRQWLTPSQRKTNPRRQSGCLRRLYTQLRKEEKQKARDKWKDIPNWTESSREQ